MTRQRGAGWSFNARRGTSGLRPWWEPDQIEKPENPTETTTCKLCFSSCCKKRSKGAQNCPCKGCQEDVGHWADISQTDDVPGDSAGHSSSKTSDSSACADLGWPSQPTLAVPFGTPRNPSRSSLTTISAITWRPWSRCSVHVGMHGRHAGIGGSTRDHAHGLPSGRTSLLYFNTGFEWLLNQVSEGRTAQMLSKLRKLCFFSSEGILLTDPPMTFHQCSDYVPTTSRLGAVSYKRI